MTHDCDDPDPVHGPAVRALPQVRLADDRDVITVLPPATMAGGDAFTPFGLPQVPRSLTDWLAHLDERFHREHHRCVAAVLLLHPARASWAMAVPAQRCGREAACWSASVADFPWYPPGAVLAGSFQTRVLAPGEAPGDCPPPHDGCHFVLVLPHRAGGATAASVPGAPTAGIWCFVRAGGVTRLVPADDVLYDDWRATIEQAMPRLRLV
jgi:hypothetical protein